MFFYNTIERSTLELLKIIQSEPRLQNLRLVGGTAIALQIGHRKSDYLDLFGRLEMDKFSLPNFLAEIGDVKTLKQTDNIHIFSVNGIKVDFVNYPYPWLFPAISCDGITIASIEDIIPMKLSAITNRGTKKDFIDIYYLLRQYPLSYMLELYKRKYIKTCDI